MLVEMGSMILILQPRPQWQRLGMYLRIIEIKQQHQQMIVKMVKWLQT
jgi:hypothetical protein